VSVRNKFLGTGEPGYNPKRKVLAVASGLRHAVLYDFSVAYKLVLSVLVLIATFALRAWVDLLLILLATGLVLITEIVNSAIEALCDFVEERHNEKIMIIKDIAAAAVGISIIVWAVVCIVELTEIWLALS
jgi:diacylglycerol kinase